MKAQSYKGIPKQYHKVVRAYVHDHAIRGKLFSPATALKRLQAHWEQQRKAEAAKEQKRLKKQRQTSRQISICDVKEGLNKLAWMRDLLSAMQNGTVDFDENGLIALMVPAIAAAGKEIEGAMYTLGVFEKKPGEGSGDFI